MAGGSLDQDDSEITGINVTPLVDVMLVLLIVFMVTSTYIVQQSIQVQLPKADTGENTPKAKNLAFVIDKSGAIFLDGKSIKLEDIAARVQAERPLTSTCSSRLWWPLTRKHLMGTWLGLSTQYAGRVSRISRSTSRTQG